MKEPKKGDTVGYWSYALGRSVYAHAVVLEDYVVPATGQPWVRIPNNQITPQDPATQDVYSFMVDCPPLYPIGTIKPLPS